MTSLRWMFLLPIITLDGARVTDAGFVVGTGKGKVEGKVTKCTQGGTVVFEEAEEVSVFSVSLEYAVGEGAGATGWVIDIPGLLQLEVDSEKVMVAEMGLPFVPTSYTVFPFDEIDPSGEKMRNSLTTNSNWISQFVIIRVSATTIRLTAVMKKSRRRYHKNVEIEFTAAGPFLAVVEPRQNLPALEYYMPMQGYIVQLKVDGETVFTQGSSNLKFPVVGTPAFASPSGIALGLSMNMVGFTHFWVWKNEMETNNHFSPNYHGFTVVDNQDKLVNDMFNGFLRWQHHQTEQQIDISPELTMKSNRNSVEISGNGTELIFSKEKITGKVIKCTVGGTVVFEKAEEDSAFEANWEFFVDNGPDGLLTGWAINIPGIVRLNINTDSLMASKTSAMESGFVPSHYTVFPFKKIDESGEMMKNAFSDEGVSNVSITWSSHTTIKIHAQVINGEMVDIEFTRGRTTANAGDYQMIR